MKKGAGQMWEKSAPKHPDKPLHSPFRAMPIGNNTFKKGTSFILESIHSIFVLPQMEDVFQDSGRMSSHWQEVQLR